MPPNQPTFFVDRNLGLYFPHYLQQNNIHALVHDEHFPQNTPDEEWLTVCGQNGWFVISMDKNIRRNPAEKNALIRHQVGLFVMVGSNLTLPEMAQIFVKRYKKVCRYIDENEPPFVAHIYRTGMIRTFYPPP